MNQNTETFSTIKIQSLSDIITNSSNEVFMIETNKTAKEIFDEILSWKIQLSYDRENEEGDEWCSGFGGEILVKDNKSSYSTYNDDNRHRYSYLEDGQVVISIDWSRRDTINKIIETFNPERID